MVRDAAATRARILDAAVAEFSEYGLAGGRVDRIAAVAAANKRAIYEHFGSKERLFDAALTLVVLRVRASVPLTEDDLPGYAARLFDHLAADPAVLRLNLWRMLERPALGPEQAALYAEKADAMRSGHGLPPVDLLVLVQAMAGAWFISPEDLVTADGSDPRSPERLHTHRAALVAAVERLTP